MPFDLSQTGLIGIKAADDSAATQAQTLYSLAQTNKTNLENQETQRDIELDKQAAAMLAKLSSGSPTQDTSGFFKGTTSEDDPAGPLAAVGSLMLRGGAIKRGTDLLKAAGDIRKQQSDIEHDRVTEAETKVDTVLKTANAVAQTIGVARNESEWRFGLAQLRKNQVLAPEYLDQLDKMEYNPDVVAYLNDQAMTAYQKATLDQTSKRDNANRRQADSRIQNAAALTDIARARLKLAQEAAARAAKNGKTPTAPNDDQVNAASNNIVQQIFGGKVPTTKDGQIALKAGAAQVAARTQELLRDNKSLTYDVALNRAIIESQAAGEWELDKESHWFKDDTIEGAKFNSAGRTPETAAPLPDKPDPKSLKKGRYYITAKGKAKWTGTAFELATP